jgi:hypothetical protein
MLTMAGASAACAAPGGPGGFAAAFGGSSDPSVQGAPGSSDFRTTAQLHFVSQMQALHTEGLKLQARDGGALSPAHRLALQEKLDVLQARYRGLR